MADLIDRQATIDYLVAKANHIGAYGYISAQEIELYIRTMPSVQPECDIPKRVHWSGWKGRRDTRYRCPTCVKPVRNDDVFCHRCGQRLMFPKISHTPYIEGQKQELIVRWDDE